MSLSTPRKTRKAVFELLERVEALAETVDVGWAVGASKCGAEEVEQLGAVLAGVEVGTCSSAGMVPAAESAVVD